MRIFIFIKNMIMVFFFIILGFTIVNAEEELKTIQKKIFAFKENYKIKEPILLKKEYINVSDKPQYCMNLSKIYISKDGGVLLETKLFQLDEGNCPLPILKPGETLTDYFWLLLGQQKNKKDWDFILLETGHYKIYIEPSDKENYVPITISGPDDIKDGNAIEEFNLKSAELFLEDYSISEKDLEHVKMVCEKYQSSYIAPYIAISYVKYLFHTKKWNDDPEDEKEKIDFEEYKKYLNIIIENHKDSLVYDEALYWMMKGYASIEGGEEKCAEYAEKLIKECPNSPRGREAKKKIEKYNLFKDIPKPVPPSKTGIGSVKFEGIEKIPEGPRTTLKKFWEALEKENLDEAFKFIAEDFWHSDMRRSGKKRLYKELKESLQEAYCEEMKLQIVDCQISSSQGKSICVINAIMSEKTQMRGDTEAKNYGDTRIKWNLRQDDKGWFIVSEQMVTRNLIAADMGEKIEFGLEKEFINYTVTDGKQKLTIYNKIKATLPDNLQVDDSQSKWKAVANTMTGEKFDIPNVTGEVTITVQKEDKKVKMKTQVILVMELNQAEDGLILKDIKIGEWKEEK